MSGKSTPSLLQWLEEAWNRNCERAQGNPLTNAVMLTAIELADRLNGEDLTLADFEAAIQTLSTDMLASRAQFARSYVAETSREKNIAAVRALARRVIDNNGTPLEFAQFQALVESEILGLVVTAHPTFSLSAELTGQLAKIIEQGAMDKETRAALLSQPHHPQARIDLDYEREQATKSLGHAQAALHLFYEVLFAEAEKTYGEHVWSIAPRLMSFASWVGYDLDGRSDIGWEKSLKFRYLSAAERARELGLMWQAIVESAAAEQATQDLSDALAQIATILAALTDIYSKLADAVPKNGEALDRVKEFSRHTIEVNPQRLELMDELGAGLDRVAALAKGSKILHRIALFQAEYATTGFAHSKVHFRLNAAQLHNAIRPQVALAHAPGRSSTRRRYLAAVSKLLDEVKPVKVNYGSLARERTTAKRLFMVIAQILKFVDAGQPIRLLIAESDTPFTVLSALYYARFFGIEKHVEICPLFETDEGLERGARVIAELLDNPHYIAYVQAQGRLCVQTGFSDSGRYVGQLAAGLGIERFRIKLAQLWKKYPLADVSLVIFDTHGESLGRGAHPGGFADRLDYIHPPKAREIFRHHNISYCQEISLQGGDGYLWLATPDLALATITRLLEKQLASRMERQANDDPFYVDTDWSLDFFLTLREFQNQAVNDPNYLPLITNLGLNLLYPSGSRVTIRQRDGRVAARPQHVAQIRAIPHNAALQQMGYLGNTLGGLGSAIVKDDEQFRRMLQNSPRCRHILALAVRAASFTQIEVLEAYLSLYDPEYWLHYASAQKTGKRRQRMLRLANHFERLDANIEHTRVIRGFYRDLMDLRASLAELLGDKQPTNAAPLIYLHILRLALIQSMFLLATRVPRFASRPDLTIEDLIGDLLHLEVTPTVALLREIFPLAPEDEGDAEYGETATYQGDQARGYAYEHRVLFDEMERQYDLMRRIGVAVINHIGAFG